MKKETKNYKGFKAVTAIVLCLMLGGCGLFKDDSDTDNSALLLLLMDADGEILSSRTTGIDLPQSIQTVPSESTASRANRIKLTQEDLR